MAQRFARCFLILEDILQKHYITLYYKKKHKFLIHLFNMKTEKKHWSISERKAHSHKDIYC